MKSPEQYKTFAQEIVAGKSMRQAMMAAGYSEKQANKGQKAVSGRMLKALAAEGYKLSDFAKKFTLEDVKNVAMGRLLQNAISGKDGGCLSAKQLGSHRELNLWTPESQAGVIVINSPSVAIEKKSQMLEDDPQT